MTAKLAPGTRLEETDQLVSAIQGKHKADTDIQALYGVSGSGTRLDANPTESGENIAKLSVVLGKGYSRESEAAITERLRETMKAHPDVWQAWLPKDWGALRVGSDRICATFS